MPNNDLVKDLVDNIDNYLKTALISAQQLQTHIQETEGDSDLYRKLAYYLTPTLNQWITGAQAGNMRDLQETLARRLAKTEKDMTISTHQGDGHEVLSKPTP